MVVIVSFAVVASPLMNSSSPSKSISSRISLLRQAVIYAKEGSPKLLDGRWNLGQSESKLGIELSDDEKTQLMACTGQIVCWTPGSTEEEDRISRRITATAVSVLRPDLLVTARHVLVRGKRAVASFGSCSFRSYLHRNVAIPVLVEKDQRRGYAFNNEDFVVVRLKRELQGCNAFAMNDSDASLPEGEQILSVTDHQLHTLNKISPREPVVAKGTVRKVLDGVLGGPPFYYADIDLDEGGSGGGVFALMNGRPVSGDGGRLVLRGISVGYGLQAKNGKPYSDERNYSIIVGLEAEFRELVEGKANKPIAVEPAPCLQGGAAKIEVIANSALAAQSEALAPSLQQYACSREAAPDRKAGTANANCAELAKGLKLAASRRGKEKREFTLRNGASCPICFSYERCNDYGCWDQVVRLSGESTLSAGVRERPPAIKHPQFCKSEQVSADAGSSIKSPEAEAEPPPPLPPKSPQLIPTEAADARKQAVEPEAIFLAAKEKAKRQGVWTLTSEDIRGLGLEQIKELRGY